MAITYYKHKANVSGDWGSGWIYYSSTSNTVATSTVPAGDWVRNVYKSGTVFSTIYEGTYWGNVNMVMTLSWITDVGTSAYWFCLDPMTTSPLIRNGFSQILSDEIIE